ncbi:hypothetical protein [Aporhodopirellula aestuarii]|uniref:Uncharacterized protein n=1 Tax=Aporhodopirellula aestuarii TaxID=2950107 RepID=A0ABT0UCD1_9BACT|nr:hypothetical protein [Aporhodopirellula aestuarii]MCM2374683.1 hypothetical protein [Aporhodopirellula aestuarii]
MTAVQTPPTHRPSPNERTQVDHRSPIPSLKPKPKLKTKRSQADKRIDYLLKTKFDDDPEFRPLLVELAELDPTPKKKYLAWLAKHWLDDWKATPDDQQRVAECLATHHKGAKYFSPLSWTGLRLEDAGYHADIFRYTPQTISRISGRIAEIIRIDEGDKQIRKGNPVALAGAEIVHRDDQFTIIRIRTGEALKRFGQNTSWCVRHGNPLGYPFPFDFILDHEGERYLANRKEVRDRWDRIPPRSVVEPINEIRGRVFDSHEKELAQVRRAIACQRRLAREDEVQILKIPDLAIEYAAYMFAGPWKEFEESVRVADLTATQAVRYAVEVRKSRWRRFENKIKRSRGPLNAYRREFPGSIPKSDEEIFREQIQDWRCRMPRANAYCLKRSSQGRAELLQRDRRYDASIASRPYSLDRYTRFLASLATSPMASRYRDKVRSYFADFESDDGRSISLPIARKLCLRFSQRMKSLESEIAKDSVCSFNYAIAMKERFLEGEVAIFADPIVAPKYRRRFIQRTPKESNASSSRSEFGRLILPANFKVAWQ